MTTPLYFQRQVIHAEDLNLGESARSDELARMRTYLHGWGVVAGLVPRSTLGPEDESITLCVSAGYGILPSGAELYLPSALTIDQALTALRHSCGAQDEGCESPDGRCHDGNGDDTAEAAEGGIQGWLIARRTRTPAAVRPGGPAGCEHPAVNQQPTRMCDGVAIELVCSLPDSSLANDASCEDVHAVMCGEGEPSELPPPVDDAGDVLVLGRIQEVDGALLVDLDGRRRLLPQSLVQDWLVHCVCPRLHDHDDPPPPIPPGVPFVPLRPGRPGRPIGPVTP